MKTLIVYASTYGYTEEMVNKMVKESNYEFESVNVLKNKSIDLSKYENPIFFTENTANNNYNIQSVNNKQVLINIVGRKYEEYNTLEKRDFHYSPLKTISKFGENCINNLYFS